MANVILGLLLLAGPQTIYDLNKHFEAGVSLFYRASLGALRSALTGLLDRGEVAVQTRQEGRRVKKLYRPTAAGEQAFFRWLRGPLLGSDVETIALAKCFFLGLLDDPAERRAVLDGILARIEEDLAELEGVAETLDALDVPQEHAEVFSYQRATLDYGLGAHRFGIDFFRALRDASSTDAEAGVSAPPSAPR